MNMLNLPKIGDEFSSIKDIPPIKFKHYSGVLTLEKKRRGRYILTELNWQNLITGEVINNTDFEKIINEL